jgi:hypothetical protein
MSKIENAVRAELTLDQLDAIAATPAGGLADAELETVVGGMGKVGGDIGGGGGGGGGGRGRGRHHHHHHHGRRR